MGTGIWWRRALDFLLLQIMDYMCIPDTMQNKPVNNNIVALDLKENMHQIDLTTTTISYCMLLFKISYTRFLKYSCELDQLTVRNQLSEEHYWPFRTRQPRHLCGFTLYSHLNTEYQVA